MAVQGQDVLLSVAADTRQFERDIQKAAANINLSLNTKGFAQPLGKISGQLGEFEKSLAASNARVIAFGASAGAIYALQRALDETFKSFVNVEKSLIEINSILNVSSSVIKNFGNNLFDIAKNTGQSFDNVAKSALEFSRQGLNIEDTLKRTSDALVLARLSGLDVVSSTEAITAALNSFSLSAENSTSLVNKLIAVDQGFAVSSADLAEAIKRVGSSAQDAGVSLDELIAIVTAAQQTTARGGAVIGNSLKTIFTRLQRPEVLDALDELGVKTRDAEGNIAPLIQILSQLAITYQNLSGTQKSQIAELVGGVFQINILKAALGDLSKEYSIFAQALSASANATNEAISKNQQLNESFAALLNKTVANFQQAASQIGGSSLGPAARKALDGLNIALQSFSGNSESDGIGAKIGEGIAKGIGNFLSGPGIILATVGLYKIFERLTKFSVDAFKTLTGINASSTSQQQLQSQILTLISKNPSVIQAINSGNIQTVQLHNQILALIQKETDSMQKQIAVAESLTRTLTKAGVNVAQTGALRGIPVTSNKSKSYGFIPNFSAEQIEHFGAALGGYKPGKVKSINIPGEGRNVYNTAESVVKFPGVSQPAIMPPKNSLAGEEYKKNFIDRNGFDPYRSYGFIPNFSNEIKQARSMAGLSSALASMKKRATLEGNNYIDIPGFEKDLTKGYKGVPKAQVDNVYASSKFQQGKTTGNKEVNSNNAMLVLGGASENTKGGYTFLPKQDIGLPRIDVIFPVIGYKDSDKKKKLEEQIQDFVKNEINNFSKELKVNPPLSPTDITTAMEGTKGLLGSIGSQSGSIFEATFRSSFGRKVRDAATPEEIEKYGTFDIIRTPADLKEFFPGVKSGVSADFKSSPSKDNREDMALKILKSGSHRDLASKIENSKKIEKSRARGFIPNFSAINDAMNREKKTSGANPQVLWSNTLGMPVVVNDNQTAEYGKNADRIIRNDHIGQGQHASKRNLMMTGSGKEKYKSFGYIPNFAPKNWSDTGWEDYDAKVRTSKQVDPSLAIDTLKKSIESLSTKIKDVITNIGQSANILKQNNQVEVKTNTNLNPKYQNLKNDDIKEILEAKKAKLSGVPNAVRDAEESLSKVSITTKNLSNVMNKMSLKYSLSATESEALAKELTGFKSIIRVTQGKIKSNFDDSNLSPSLRSFKQNAIFASIGMSMVGGLLQSFAGDNKKAGKAIEGLTQGLSSATTVMGLIPGKAGLVTGGLIALATGANALGRLFTDKAQDLESKLENVKKSSSEFSSSSQRYMQARQRVDDAFANPGKVNDSDLQKMNEELVNSMMDLPSAHRAHLMSILDGTKLQEEVNKIQAENATQQKNLEFITQGQKKVDDYNSLFGSLGKSFKTLFLDAAPFRGNSDELRDKRGLVYEDKNDLKNAAKSFIDSLGKEGKKTFLDLGKNSDALSKFQKADRDGFMSMLKGMGANSDTTNFLSGLNSTEIKNIQSAMAGMARESALSAKVLDATSESRKKYITAIEEEKLKIKEAEASVKEFEKTLDLVSQSAVDYGLFSSKFKSTQDASNRDLSLQRASGMINYEKAYMTDSGIANLDYLFNKTKSRNDFARETTGVANETRQSLLSLGSKMTEDLRRKNESGESKVDNSKIIDFQSQLAKIANSNLSPAEMKNAISAAYRENLSRSMNEGESNRFDAELNSIMDKQSTTLIELNQKQEINNNLAKAQLDATLKQLDRDINIKSMGGFQGFISNDRENRLRDIEESSLNIRGLKSQRQREAEKSRQEAFDQEDARRKQSAYDQAKAKAISEGRSMFTYNWEPVDRGSRFKGDDSIDRGRAAAKLALETLTAMGGVKPGEEKLYQSLKDTAVKSRAEDLRQQAKFIGDQLRSVGQGGLARAVEGRDWNQTARDQIDEAIKTQNATMTLVKNTDSLAADVKNISSILNQTDASVNDSMNKEGINQAIQAGLQAMAPGYFDNLIKSTINQLNQSKTNADNVKSESELRQKILQGQAQQNTLQAEAKERTGMIPELRGNLDVSKVDPAIIKYITEKIEEAKSKDISIPDLTDLAKDAAGKGVSGSDQLLDASNQAPSYQGQAIKEYIENLQRLQAIQALQKQQAEKLLSDQQALQTQTSANQNIATPATFQPLSQSQTLPGQAQTSNLQNGSVTVPQGNVTIPQANVNINGGLNQLMGGLSQLNPILQGPVNQPTNQNLSTFDPKKIGEIISQAIKGQDMGTENLKSLATNIETSFKSFSDAVGSFNSGIDSLKESIDSGNESNLLEGRIDVQLSPMKLDGEIGMKLTGDPIKIEFDLSDMETLKREIEKIFAEKFAESEEQLRAELESFIDSAVSTAMSARGPRPPRYSTNRA